MPDCHAELAICLLWLNSNQEIGHCWEAFPAFIWQIQWKMTIGTLCVREDMASQEKHDFKITVSMVGPPLPDFWLMLLIISLTHAPCHHQCNWQDAALQPLKVQSEKNHESFPIRMMWHKSKNRRRRSGKARLSLRIHTSLGCVRTEPALVIGTGEVSALTGKKGRDQCDCQHFFNEVWETFINCSVLLCRNTQFHDGMPLVPVPSTDCSKISVKKNYFPFIRILSRMEWCFPSALGEGSWSQSLGRKVVPSSVLQDGFNAQFTVSIWSLLYHHQIIFFSRLERRAGYFNSFHAPWTLSILLRNLET